MPRQSLMGARSTTIIPNRARLGIVIIMLVIVITNLAIRGLTEI